jgi:hypothetical protein
MSAPEAKTKQFGAGERKIPHHSEKASKYYPAEDDKQKKTVRLDRYGDTLVHQPSDGISNALY